MTGRVYLDFNATAPLRPEAREAMLAAMDVVGNPSSVHAEGREARAVVESARRRVAALVDADPEDVIFTSCATEAASVLAQFETVDVEPDAHDCLWSRHRPGVGRSDVFACGYANSETGAVRPPRRDDGGWVAASGGRADRLLVDLVQAAGRMDLSFSDLGADFAILSAHKLGGPKGVGALLVRGGLDVTPLQTGGGQERRRRAGTENVVGIAGFGAAAEAARRDLDSGAWQGVAKLRTILESSLSEAVPDLTFFGEAMTRLANTSCFALPGWRGETQVMQMDLAGFAVSSGAACSSGKVGPSRALKAAGADETLATSAIRVSLGLTTTEREVTDFAAAWTERCGRFLAKAA